jgi:hypothetical protein
MIWYNSGLVPMTYPGPTYVTRCWLVTTVTGSVGVMGLRFGRTGDSGGGIIRGTGEIGVRGQLWLKTAETIDGSLPNAARV